MSSRTESPLRAVPQRSRARTIIAVTAVFATAVTCLAYFGAGRAADDGASGAPPFGRALATNRPFAALPDGDVVVDASDADITRTAGILFAADPAIAARLAEWVAVRATDLGYGPDGVERRSTVARFAPDGSARCVAVLEGRYDPKAVHAVFAGGGGAQREVYRGQVILSAPGRGAASVVDERHLVVADSTELVERAVDAATGREPTAESGDAYGRIARLRGAARVAGRMPEGARLTGVLPPLFSASSLAGSTFVASLEVEDGVLVGLDLAAPSPARAEMALARLRTDLTVGALAASPSARLALASLAPFASLAREGTHVSARLEVPASAFAALVSATTDPADVGAGLPASLLAPLPAPPVDPALMPSPAEAAAGLPPAPGAPVQDVRSASPGTPAIAQRRVRGPDAHPFVWSPNEEASGDTDPTLDDPRMARTIAALGAIVEAERRYRDRTGNFGTLEDLVEAGLLDEAFGEGRLVGGFRIGQESFGARDFEVVAEPVEADAPNLAFAADRRGVRYAPGRSAPRGGEGIEVPMRSTEGGER